MADTVMLAPATTTTGLIELVLLHETRTPLYGKRYDAAEALLAMRLMRQVLRNRLKHPGLFGAARAVEESDLIKIRSQFGDFANAPQIPQAFLYSVTALVRIANNPKDPRHKECLAHVRAAIIAATEAHPPAEVLIANLYYWRTQGASSPSPKSRLFKIVQGNAFYTQDLP